MVNKDKFFEQLEEGEVFTYSDGYLFKEVQKMAERRAVNIEYCQPGTIEYKLYGCMTARVIRNKIINPEVQMFHFDPKMIVFH